MLIRRSVAAGAIIALVAVVNLIAGGLAGAALFSAGLLLICVLGANLFTGKVSGLVTKDQSVKDLLVMLVFNFAGVALVCCSLWFCPKSAVLESAAKAVTAARVSAGLLKNGIASVWCGVWVWLGVTGYKKTSQPLVVMMPVLVFVVSGLPHCIADAAYVLLAKDFSAALQILPVILGNSLGACLFAWLFKEK